MIARMEMQIKIQILNHNPDQIQEKNQEGVEEEEEEDVFAIIVAKIMP